MNAILPRKGRAPLKAPSDAPTRRYVAASSLSTAAGEDAQLVMSVAWKRTAGGTFITNSTGNTMTVSLRSPSAFAVRFGSGENTDTNLDGVRHRPRMGWIAVRAFTDFSNRGAWTYIRPTYSPGGGAFIHSFAGDSFVEIRPVGPCDAEGASPALESMRTSEEGAAADRGMWWEVEGFYVNTEAVFDVVRIPNFPIEVLTLSDSNAGGYVDPESGGEYYGIEAPRNALIGQGTSISYWDKRGSNVQWYQKLLDGYCDARGLYLDIATENHGGAWQAVCGPNTRANLEGFWPGVYQDLVDRYLTPFQDGDSIIGGAYHLNGGAWRPGLIMPFSFANDLLRGLYEFAGLFGASGEAYFRGSTLQTNVKALADSLLTTFPDAKVCAVTSTQTDAGAGGATDTMARVRLAFTAGGGSGRKFQNGATAGAEGATGLFLALSDYAATTGITTVLSSSNPKLHYTDSEHTKIVDVISPIFAPWFDTARGVIYVDGVAGNDANAGTFALPKKTIPASGYTRLGLKRGSTYTTITVPASGTSGVPVTYFAWGTGSAPVVTAINTNAKSNVVVHGIDVNGMVTIASGTGIRIVHCTVRGSGTHGFSITGGTVTIDFTEIHSNTNNGINMTAGTVTARGLVVHGNEHGVKVAGGTFTHDRSHIYDNTKRGIWTAGGASVGTNSKLAMIATPPVNDTADLTTFHGASYNDGGTAAFYNCFFFNGSTNGRLAYAIRALSSGQTTFKNCVFDRVRIETTPYILAESVGASGNIAAASNNVYLGASDIDILFGYGASWAAILGNLKTFAGWTALTARTGGMDAASKRVTNESGASVSSSMADDAALMPTDLTGAGADLSATFTKDYFKRTRTAWDVGPWAV